jgi:hypothetical protein
MAKKEYTIMEYLSLYRPIGYKGKPMQRQAFHRHCTNGNLPRGVKAKMKHGMYIVFVDESIEINPNERTKVKNNLPSNQAVKK